jgi:hypothetical protein
MTTVNNRVARAEQNRQYTRASYHYADHLIRAGRRAMRLIVETRQPVNFPKLSAARGA